MTRFTILLLFLAIAHCASAEIPQSLNSLCARADVRCQELTAKPKHTDNLDGDRLQCDDLGWDWFCEPWNDKPAITGWNDINDRISLCHCLRVTAKESFQKHLKKKDPELFKEFKKAYGIE